MMRGIVLCGYINKYIIIHNYLFVNIGFMILLIGKQIVVSKRPKLVLLFK